MGRPDRGRKTVRKPHIFFWICNDCEANETEFDRRVSERLAREHAVTEDHAVLLMRVYGDIEPRNWSDE